MFKRCTWMLAPLALLAAPLIVHAAENSPEPQRPLIDFQPAEAVWIIIIFVILLIILYPTAWKNVLAGLKAREERIRKDIADAEAAHKKAEATLAEYAAKLAAAENQVRDMLVKAAAEAGTIAQNIKNAAQKDAEAQIERAKQDIEAARDQAIHEIYVQAADLATTVAAKIIRKNLNADDQRELVNQSLEELQSSTGVSPV